MEAHQTLITLPSGSYLLVEIPTHINKIVWEKGNEGKVLWMFSIKNDLWHDRRVRINPPGNYQIVGKGNEITDQQWEYIVDYVRGGFFGHIYGWKDYNESGFSMDEPPLKTALMSGLSLIKSNGFNPSATLILKSLK